MEKTAMTSPPADRNDFVQHTYPEQTIDLGEVTMNYAVSGSSEKPALLLIPGQTESWWGFEAAMAILEREFQVYAVDLRGQGRSTWTPRRYTFDNMGNDLVRFIALAIKRPVIVSGNSSGGVLAAWLAAFSMPGQVRGAHLEDPPLFASEVTPLFGPAIRQSVVGPMFAQLSKYLGDQWSIADWKGMLAARANDPSPVSRMLPMPDEPAQRLKEYDPEWARAFIEGTVAKSCPHERMLAQVKVPMLMTHHFRTVHPETGTLMGALTDLQASMARDIVTRAGRPFTYVDAPDAAHSMHAMDPPRFASILSDWAKTLPKPTSSLSYSLPTR
jgi:pimeloyl-ACP methyl ester carboxylesterase